MIQKKLNKTLIKNFKRLYNASCPTYRYFPNTLPLCKEYSIVERNTKIMSVPQFRCVTSLNRYFPNININIPTVKISTVIMDNTHSSIAWETLFVFAYRVFTGSSDQRSHALFLLSSVAKPNSNYLFIKLKIFCQRGNFLSGRFRIVTEMCL